MIRRDTPKSNARGDHVRPRRCRLRSKKRESPCFSCGECQKRQDGTEELVIYDNFELKNFVGRVGSDFIVCRPETIKDAFTDDEGCDILILGDVLIRFRCECPIKSSVQFNDIKDLIGTQVLPLIVTNLNRCNGCLREDFADENLVFSYDGTVIGLRSPMLKRDFKRLLKQTAPLKRFPMDLGAFIIFGMGRVVKDTFVTFVEEASSVELTMAIKYSLLEVCAVEIYRCVHPTTPYKGETLRELAMEYVYRIHRRLHTA